MNLLRLGPNRDEAAEGLRSALPPGLAPIPVAVAEGTAIVELPAAVGALPRANCSSPSPRSSAR